MRKSSNDELQPEYSRAELGKGVRGKYLKSYGAATNLVLLTPEVAEAFPTDDAVNEALRSLIEVAEHAGRRKHPNSTPSPSPSRSQ